MNTQGVCLRTIIATLLSAILGLSVVGDDAEVKPPTQGCMQVITDDGKPVDLPLKHTDVKAEISGFVTRVKVVQTFTTPYDTPIEAVYVFPLPQDAAVSDMTIRIGDRVIKGQIKKRDEARKIYEDAKAAGKTTALLDQERPNIFTQSVANIMPGHEILIEITYDQVLKYEKGQYEFAFPMVVGPRFNPASVTDAESISPPVLKPGERNGHDISLTVTLNAGVPVHRLECPTHEVAVEPTPASGHPSKGGESEQQIPSLGGVREAGGGSDVLTGPVTITLSPNDAIPNKDFVLRYNVAGEKPEIGLLTHRGELGGHFLLMFQPPEEPAPDLVSPKEMVFVLDCSGSMSGEPMAISKKVMRYALKNLNPGDSFQIIRFSESASPFAEKPLENTPENVRRGLSYINGLSGSGGTMMIEGIKAALDFPHKEDRLRIVCFLTDGYIGNEGEILGAIEKKLGDNTRLFSLGVGSSVNRYLLERMGEVGRGEVQYALLNGDPEEPVKKFYERVRNPVLTHIEVDWAGLDVEEITPALIPDLFAGQPLFLLGKYDKAGKAAIKVHAKLGGKDVTYKIPVELPANEEENGAVAPLWARARIKELESEQYGQQNEDVVEKVTELALKYRLMSQYTSFVAVEEKVVNEDGEIKTIQVPVEMPEGVSYEGVFGKDDARLQTANAPAASGGRGLFFGGLAYRKSAAVACQVMPARELECTEVAFDAVAEPVDKDDSNVRDEEKMHSVLDYALRFVSLDGATVIEITRSGEVWFITNDNSGNVKSRVLKGRLKQREYRSLSEDLLNAIASGTGNYLSTGQSGTLTVRLFDHTGALDKEVVIQLGPSAQAVSQAWNDIADQLQRLVQ